MQIDISDKGQIVIDDTVRGSIPEGWTPEKARTLLRLAKILVVRAKEGRTVPLAPVETADGVVLMIAATAKPEKLTWAAFLKGLINWARQQ